MSKNLCYLDLNTASKHYFFTRFLTNYCLIARNAILRTIVLFLYCFITILMRLP